MCSICVEYGEPPKQPMTEEEQEWYMKGWNAGYSLGLNLNPWEHTKKKPSTSWTLDNQTHPFTD